MRVGRWCDRLGVRLCVCDSREGACRAVLELACLCCRRAGRDGAPAASLLYASDVELRDARKMERWARQGGVAAVATAHVERSRPATPKSAMLAEAVVPRSAQNTR